MANYNTNNNNKPKKPAEIYPGLVKKLALASYHLTQINKLLGPDGVAKELEISRQSIQVRGVKEASKK